MAHIKITYIGHASFRFESEQGTVIYYDPWLEGSPVANLHLDDIDRADIVIATHGHSDHGNDAFKVVQKTGATFVGNYEMCIVANAHGIELGKDSVPLNPGGSTTIKDVTITLTQTHHSLSLSSDLVPGGLPEGLHFHPDGTCVGAVCAFDNGITLYDTSDTCVFSDMQLIGQMYGPQIAIMPVGGCYTMDVRQAARAASFIRPDVVIPCHYGEAVGQPADIHALEEGVNFLSPGTQVVPMQVDQTLTYTASQVSVE